MVQIEKLIPDISVILEGLVTKNIKKREINPKEILVHEHIIAYIENAMNNNKTIGYIGVDELKALRDLKTIRYIGKAPKSQQLKYNEFLDLDQLIRDAAYDEDATVLTANKNQARICEAKGIKFVLLKIPKSRKKIVLEKFFDKTTMSVHIRENTITYAKKGKPGEWKSVPVGTKMMDRDDIIKIAREITEEANTRKDGFIEIERKGSTIIQLADFRIVVTMPPFSDGWEITAVRPVKRLTLKDYKLTEKLMDRIDKHAEGILVAGSPGMGKSTFAQALAEFYMKNSKTVKTVEAPRDLILPENITQYAISHGSQEEVHDVLLLTRPDYTVFDEMRNTDDFNLFSDMRLSGVGMIGIVHATNAVDSIQRFMTRVELGVIPQIVDTVIFIKFGAVEKVLNLDMTVKVPSGMTEADLARPVVEVKDFELGNLDYEIYTFGEQTVVMPVGQVNTQAKGKAPVHNIVSKSIENEFMHYAKDVKVEIISDHKARVYVPAENISGIIGKGGRNIEKIEKQLGIGLDIEELKQEQITQTSKSQLNSQTSDIQFETKVTGKAIEFSLGSKQSHKDIDIILDGEYLLSAKVGNGGNVKIHKKNKFGKILTEAYNKKRNIALKFSS